MEKTTISRKNQKPLTILISGSSLSGNKGAMAMALVLAKQLREIKSDCRLLLLSKYFKQDAPFAPLYGIELIKAPPSRLVSLTLIRSLVVMLLRSVPTQWLYDSVMKAYRDSDILVDLSGVSFSDDLDWRGKMLSVAWLAPALATKTPYVKLSQALGPFRKRINRWAARFFLKQSPLLIARGTKSAENVRELLGPENKCHVCYDTAFLLEPSDEKTVDQFLKQRSIPGGGFVGISPSAVVDRKAKGKHQQAYYRNAIAELIRHITETTGSSVVLIPHAWPQTGRGTEDMHLCLEITAKLPEVKNVYVIKQDLDPSMLKGIISRSEVFVSCRFHAMIASLSSKVPTLVVGWGHKYNEIMQLFGHDEFCYDFSTAGGAMLTESFGRLWRDREKMRGLIEENLQEVENSSRENFRLLREYLEENDLL